MTFSPVPRSLEFGGICSRRWHGLSPNSNRSPQCVPASTKPHRCSYIADSLALWMNGVFPERAVLALVFNTLLPDSDSSIIWIPGCRAMAMLVPGRQSRAVSEWSLPWEGGTSLQHISRRIMAVPAHSRQPRASDGWSLPLESRTGPQCL